MGDFQHFVPRFYLKGFVDPSSVGREKLEPYLWVVDIVKETIKNRAPKNIAGFSGYYVLHSESFKDKRALLDNSLTTFETRAARIIRQIRDKQFKTTVEERYHLANFIGIQLGRVPIFRRHINANIKNAPNQWLRDYAKDDNRLQQRFGKDAELCKDYVLSGKFNVQTKFKDETHKRDFIVSLAINLGLEFAQLVFGMRWVFMLSTGDATFFTSDNPARLMSPDAKPLKIRFGELNEELEVSFPVSSTCTLLMHSHDIIQNPDISSNEVIKVDNNTVAEINWRILPTIDKYAFCSKKEQGNWILEQVKKNAS